MALSIAAFLIWNIVALVLVAQVMGFEIFYGYYRLNTACAGMVVWTIVTATLIWRSFIGPERTKLTLLRLFALVSTAAALLALYVNDPNAGDVLSALRFHVPHVLLYGLAVWAVFTARYWLVAGIGVIAVGAGMGYAVAHRGIAPWTTIAECVVYSTTLVVSLAILRVSDRFAREDA